VHEGEDLLVPRKDDMGPTRVEGESLPGPRTAETADGSLPLEYLYFVPLFMEEPGNGYPGKAPSQDSPSHAYYLRSDAIYGLSPQFCDKTELSPDRLGLILADNLVFILGIRKKVIVGIVTSVGAKVFSA
jgi:hypothetical protein